MTRAIDTRCRPIGFQRGVTLVELMVTAAISILILAGLNSVIRITLESKTALETRNELSRQASFAMQRMVRAASYSRRLSLPLPDNPNTNWREDVREQTFPSSAPEGDSTNATAVLAVALPAYSDLDFNGVPDADNDADGLIDEDMGGDVNGDVAAGIYAIDDDGDGGVDEGLLLFFDDDEDGLWDEDEINGVDDDGDGAIDSDSPGNANADGCPGICGVDDDFDGLIDEGSGSDDDEDGSIDEDWYDTVVFYLDSEVLKERTPVPWDESGIGGITGRDFVVSEIADGVTLLRFERLPQSVVGVQLIDITLTLTAPDGESLTLNRRVRIGGAL